MGICFVQDIACIVIYFTASNILSKMDATVGDKLI